MEPLDRSAGRRTNAGGTDRCHAVPLDATDAVPVRGLWPSDVASALQTPAIGYLRELLAANPSARRLGFFHWDELAAVAVVDPLVIEVATRTLTIGVDAGPDLGRTMIAVDSRDGTEVVVATGVSDPDAFRSRLLSTMAGSEATLLPTRRFDATIAAEPPDPSAGTDVVLAFWVANALAGEVDRASRVTTADTEWSSLGSTPDAFVEGSGPFAADIVAIECVSDGPRASCDVRWSDLWLGAIPDIAEGALRVEASTAGGVIESFDAFDFDPRIPAAFEAHLGWLAATQPEDFQTSCATEPAASSCSALLIATVADWAESEA